MVFGNASSRWFRFNLGLHRWTSLIATLPFLVLCLTGSVLIFHDEIDQAMGVVPGAATVQAASHTATRGSQSMRRPDTFVHTLLMALVCMLGIVGMLLSEGIGDWFFLLAALPVIYGGWRMVTRRRDATPSPANTRSGR